MSLEVFSNLNDSMILFCFDQLRPQFQSSGRCPCPWQGGLEMDDLDSPFQPKPFYDSVIQLRTEINSVAVRVSKVK